MQEFALHNYDMFVNNAPHRGMIIYAHKSLTATVVKFNDDLDFQEYVLCEFRTYKTGVSVLFACIYRNPTSGPGNNGKLFELLNTIDEHPAKLKCIVGDFNMPGIG